MSTRKTMLVVPTCRPESIGAFFTAWADKGGWDAVCVIEDAPERSPALWQVLPPGTLHVAHDGIDADLDTDAWVISRRDSAVRAYGFLEAYRAGMDVLTLDDDCFPPDSCSPLESFVDQHQASLRHLRWVESVPGMRTRGLPYRNRGTLEAKVNVGLWTGVPDLDGPQGLLSPRSDFIPPHGSRLIPHGQYIPVCGMNLYVRHDAIPLMHFALMGEGQPYRRFDDIWGGIILKKALDYFGWGLSVGEPFVEHRRASDPLANLVKEAPGLAANETFWEVVDAAPLEPNLIPTDVMVEIGNHLAVQSDPYLKKLGVALGVWARLCSPEVSPGKIGV